MVSDRYIPIIELINLTSKRAIVTGGAAGIGFSISYRLAEAGASVLIADINEEKGNEARKKIEGYGYQVAFLKCDISKKQEVKTLVDTAVKKMNGIDILVNNAGIYPQIPLSKVTEKDFNRVIDVNLKGTFLCSRDMSQQMIEQGQGGNIINIASIESVHPSHKGLSAYDASKGGVLTLTKSLALELGQHGIRVNAIAPGGIATEGLSSRFSSYSTKQSKAQLKKFISRMMLRRMGRADDIGRVALFLASDLASYITGSLIIVDGGYLVS